MDRRRFLTAAGAGVSTGVALAGCATNQSAGECTNPHTLTLEPTTPRYVGHVNVHRLEGLGKYEGQVARRALAQGYATVSGRYNPPLDEYYPSDGAYYEIGTETDTKTVQGVEYGVRSVDDSPPDESESVVTVAELPEQDVHTLWGALDYPTTRELELAPNYDTRMQVGYRNAGRRSESRLYPKADFEYVRAGSAVFEVSFRKQREVPVSEVRYTATYVSSKLAAVGERVLERHGKKIPRERLTDQQQQIVATASDVGYRECGDPNVSGSFEQLLFERLWGGNGHVQYVRLGESWYRVYVEYPMGS